MLKISSHAEGDNEFFSYVSRGVGLPLVNLEGSVLEIFLQLNMLLDSVNTDY
jgi:hypothetical protein